MYIDLKYLNFKVVPNISVQLQKLTETTISKSKSTEKEEKKLHTTIRQTSRSPSIEDRSVSIDSDQLSSGRSAREKDKKTDTDLDIQRAVVDYHRKSLQRSDTTDVLISLTIPSYSGESYLDIRSPTILSQIEGEYQTCSCKYTVIMF